MPCIEQSRPRPEARIPGPRAAIVALAAFAAALLVACGSPPPPPPSLPAPAPARPATPAAPAAGPTVNGQVTPQVPRRVSLPAPATPRTQRELEHQLANRLVQAHPDTSYLTRAPDRLLAIPVLEIELNADGSVRRIDVLRHPKTGSEATKLAIEAVHRAAPYGQVSHLPRPWKVVETFLFDDALRFKPRLLDSQ